METKKGKTQFCPLSSFIVVVGSRIRHPGWGKIRIRDKRPGSATLLLKHWILLASNKSLVDSPTFARSLPQSLEPKTGRKLGIWQTSPQKSRTQKGRKARRFGGFSSAVWYPKTCLELLVGPALPVEPELLVLGGRSLEPKILRSLSLAKGFLSVVDVINNWERNKPGTRSKVGAWRSAGAS